ncbi:MAG: insulinase family protein [Prevotella sp.]|nr:insulinase family protein [Prevotella sp.]
MKRFLISTLISLAASSTAFSMTQQVRTGTLPNGLTYYIMRNQEPKGQADFFLAQRTGSVQEKENERGLAHFLEHMAFNGSEHFPGNSLITYLESIGVKFGADLNAYTSTDETVYNISRVPTVRQSSLDSCLLILRDWSSALCLNDSDIDAERGVIEGEWRHRSAASNRILEKILPQIYPGSIYGKRMPIGLMSVVKNFKPETLRGYYRRWHRPENQAVIVVGDFNPDIMEAKVKQMFSPLKAGNAKGGKAMLPKVPDNKKMIVAIGSDPEQGHNMLQLHFKHKAPELTGEDYWRRKVGESLLGSMLAERMDSLEQTADCPWQSLGVGFTNFLLSRGEHSFVMRGIVKKGREKDAFSAWYAEVLRALDHGFTPEELEMAKTEYMGELTKQRRNKKDSNTAYSRRWVRHFLD